MDIDLLSSTLDTATTSRVIELERRAQGSSPLGDFEGSVTGYWVELDRNGVGIVEHKGKRYKTRSIGFISLPRSSEVELTYANGVYYSKF